MAEIIIPNPLLNDNLFRQWTTPESEDYKRIKDFLEGWKISPQTHPIACDLCAGDGLMAHLLVELSWLPENITCFDYQQPRPPLVKQVNWQYWDLEALGQFLSKGQTLPAIVEKHRHRYDLVMAVQMEITSTLQEPVIHFFLKQNESSIFVGI